MSVERRSAFGKVGDYLGGVLERNEEWFSSWRSSGLTSDLVTVHRLSLSGCKDAELPLAASLLLLDFPVQIDVSEATWLSVVRSSLSLPFDLRSLPTAPSFHTRPFNTQRAGSFCRSLSADQAALATHFPPKNNTAGSVKLNVVPHSVVRSALVVFGSEVLYHLLRSTSGELTDDRLAGLLMYASVLSNRFGQQGFVIAWHLVMFPDDAKDLSTAAKALGLNSTPWGALFCEAQTLAGRAYGDIDLKANALSRCSPDEVSKMVIPASAEALRPHVRAIIRSELPPGTTLPSLDDFWSRRWLWCVNGSHTSQSSRALGLDPKFMASTHQRVYRRTVAESIKTEPISTWDGKVYVSPSPKLEHGKTRAIYACDTRSYFAFSWVLKTVQDNWRNRRVLLDPGVGGHIGLVRRITKYQRSAGVNLMLDYDDFNSHHSNEVMSMVFDELLAWVGAPAWYRDLICSSFNKTYMMVDGEFKRVVGTLMSGHRATTFINSVLNAAYIRSAVGAGYFDKLGSLHAGDDVYVRCPTVHDCQFVLEATARIGCRMNPTKQSIGFNGAEFLRMGIRGDAAYGYVARSISSFVSGNWANPDPMAACDALRSAITGARSIINRGGTARPIELVAGALRYCKGVPLPLLLKLLKGECSIDDGPVFGCAGTLRTYKPVPVEVEDFVEQPGWSGYASRDYLTKHATDIEMAAIEMTGTNVLKHMVASSYSKGLDHAVFKRPPSLTLVAQPPIRPRGYIDAVDLLDKPSHDGILSGYPLIQLVKNRLTDRDLRELFLVLGYRPPTTDLRKAAFGGESGPKNVIGVLSYADAAALSKRTTAGNIVSHFACRV
ncbi:MAG: RNA-dependent RNA polymerase [Hangzhou totivirus 5]|nr:MAG: RNA-dependent RNA polymerase [Hangzhou totivirus 5]